MREASWRLWAGLALALVVGGVAGGLIVAATQEPSSGSPSGSATTSAATATATGGVCDAISVSTRTLPSVVTIFATGEQGSGTGSGEVIREDGYILTNNHVIVIAANGGQVGVLFNDGKQARATIVGRDTKSDLAVIKVGAGKLPVIPLGSSAGVVVGQPVVVLGAPLGLSNTVTAGIVSALDRTVEVPAEEGKNALLVSALQTDAAINPGNSGGAMVDCAGRLIGVPSAGASVPDPNGGSGGGGSIGLGFAIPVDFAKDVAQEIIETGKVTHAYFGVDLVTVPSRTGVYVRSVTPGGPAAKAGLAAGDVITTVDGKPVGGTDDIAAVTLTKNPGDTVTVGYTRDGKQNTAKVTLGTAP